MNAPAHPLSDAGRCPYRLDPTGADIHGEGAALRALGPASPVELPGGVIAWGVTDPGLIRRLLTHRDISKDMRAHWPGYRDLPADWPLRPWVDVKNMLTAYGPEHSRLRRLVAGAFGHRRVMGLAPVITAITDRLLDRLIVASHGGENSGGHRPGRQPVDLRAGFAYQLPLEVICHLFGIPGDDEPGGAGMRDGMRMTVEKMFRTDISADEATANAAELYGILEDLIALKRAAPGDDLTSDLIAAHESGDELSEQELIDTLLLFIGAGHETTVNLISHAVVNLLTHPDQLALIRSGNATWRDAVEETLRHQSPIANLIMRVAVRDVYDQETGLMFRAGSPIVIGYAASNRSPELYHDPDVFDLTRPAGGHLAFGHGTHYCLGAPLARLEADIALPSLFIRFPHLRLADTGLEPLPSFISHGFTSLPVYLGDRP